MQRDAQIVSRYGVSPQCHEWTAPIIPDAGYQLANPETMTGSAAGTAVGAGLGPDGDDEG